MVCCLCVCLLHFICKSVIIHTVHQLEDERQISDVLRHGSRSDESVRLHDLSVKCFNELFKPKMS